MGKYDPDPKRKRGRRRGHRKGVEPAGLKRWRLAQKRRTHDPRRGTVNRKPYSTGRRGGAYWTGGTKRRYDPAPRRRGYRAKARGFLGKIEKWFNKYAGWIGGLGTVGIGVKGAYDALTNFSYPDDVGNKNAWERWWWLLQREYQHLLYWGEPQSGVPIKDMPAPAYLKYKFTESAWSAPFWASLGTWIFSKLPLPFKNISRIQKPLGKIAGAGLIVSTIGGLVLPGCSPSGTSTSTSPNTHGRTYVYGK